MSEAAGWSFQSPAELSDARLRIPEFSRPCATTGGPDERLGSTIGHNNVEYVRSRSWSTFPYIRFPKREQDPIADRYYCQHFGDRIITAMADGSGPRLAGAVAAERAVVAFVDFVSTVHFKVDNIQEMGAILLRGICVAQEAVCGHSTRVTSGMGPEGVGTTSLLGGIIVPVPSQMASPPNLSAITATAKEETDRASSPLKTSCSTNSSPSTSPSKTAQKQQWIFVGAGVGHCKLFLFRASDRSITEVTKGNYAITRTRKAQNIHGQLGNVYEVDQPNYGNLSLYSIPCAVDDVFFFTTPGIHENLDPVVLGKEPADLGLGECLWTAVDPTISLEAKSAFACDQLLSMLGKQEDTPAHLEPMIRAIEERITEQTEAVREGDNGNGRLDHCSIVAVRVKKVKFAEGGASASPMKGRRLQGGGRGRGRGRGRGGGPSGIGSRISLEMPPPIPSAAGLRTEFWTWKVFIPMPEGEEVFSLWDVLPAKKQFMKTAIDSCKESTFACYHLHINDPAIELRTTGNRNVLELRLRKKIISGTELWHKLGSTAMNSTTPKKKLFSTIRSMLAENGMDLRRADTVLQKLNKFQPASQLIEMRGTKKQLRVAALGASFSLLTGNFIMSQSEMELTGEGGESLGKFRIVDFQGDKGEYIASMVERIILPHIQPTWKLMNFSEFFMHVLPVS